MLKYFFIIILFFTSLTEVNAQCVPGSPPLATVIVDSVSVLPGSSVIICWQQSTTDDILEYDIIMFDPVTLADITIATVPFGAGLCFIIPFGDANNTSDSSPREYGVRVKDICGNASTNGDNYHNTMFLENTINVCAASVNLKWNAYDDFTSGPNVLYEIFVSQDAAPFISAGTTNATNFTFSGIVQGSSYKFYVRAIENNGVGPFSSSTNIINLNADFFLKDPNFLYLYRSTVVSDNQIDIQFYVDTAADAKSYTIKRMEKPTDGFIAIGSINATSGMNPMLSFSDFNVESKIKSYTYIVEMVNLCNEVKITSNIGKTILLYTINDKLELTNTIIWIPYEGWVGGISGYEIYRAFGGVWETTPIASMPALLDTIIYVDDVSTVLKGNGEFCYKVIALEGPALRVGNLSDAKSASNEDCVDHDPLIYIPNAFAPESSFNPIFKPVVTFAEPNSYQMIIYNRWGQEVFKTKNIEEGWNGAFNNKGDLQEIGVYVYFIEINSSGNQQYQYRGKVTMVR